jgi:hypothetical protein
MNIDGNGVVVTARQRDLRAETMHMSAARFALTPVVILAVSSSRCAANVGSKSREAG